MKSIVAVELGEVIFVHIRFFIILRIGVHICRALNIRLPQNFGIEAFFYLLYGYLFLLWNI